jgi:uncharacterized protein
MPSLSQYISGLLSQYIFLIPLVVIILCELAKVAVESARTKEFAFDHFFHSGGFPSSHSAFVASLLIVVWQKMGIESVEFAISAVFAVIIWYDAMSSRREIGLQAEALNRLQRKKHFQTRVGHSLVEVIGGIVFGLIVTWAGIWLSV